MFMTLVVRASKLYGLGRTFSWLKKRPCLLHNIYPVFLTIKDARTNADTTLNSHGRGEREENFGESILKRDGDFCQGRRAYDPELKRAGLTGRPRGASEHNLRRHRCAGVCTIRE